MKPASVLKAIIVTLSLFCVACCFPSESYASAVSGTKTPFSQIRQQERFKALENNNNQLILKLETLQMELAMLEHPQMQLLERLQQAEESLNKTRNALNTSLASLENAERLQKETEILLNKLEMQINKLIAQKKRYRRERNIALIVAGTMLVYAAKKS